MACSPCVILCTATYSSLPSPPRTVQHSVPWVVRRSECSAPAVSKCVTFQVTAFPSDPRSSGMLRRVVVLTKISSSSRRKHAITLFLLSQLSFCTKETQGKTTTTGHHQHQRRYRFHSPDCHDSWSMLWPPAAFLESQWAFCSGRRIQLMLLFDATVAFQRTVWGEYRGFNISNGVCLPCGT